MAVYKARDITVCKLGRKRRNEAVEEGCFCGELILILLNHGIVPTSLACLLSFVASELYFYIRKLLLCVFVGAFMV